ncbi:MULTISPECIES: thermonuclease family protein [unclassified Rhizobium]|uniref:thermonuclease family protein n=1 Tax=unclassified Rhizobium TaxID=2613769 RepID=UPI000A52D941|nr:MULTISPECIES: thermonuclease family protein [unclassified Rhizobium]MDM9621945.1 thermonuclease family protein [Rhizobium sp. S96]
MLSEAEIAHFKSRIEEILCDGKPTEWQRRFLIDMRDKIGRYGVRTRLSEKQLAMLRRLTMATVVTPVFRADAEGSRPEPFRPSLAIRRRPRSPTGRNPFPQNPLRIRNPLPPRNPFRPRYSRRLPFLSGRATLVLVALVLVVGIIESLLDRGTATSGRSPVVSTVEEPAAPQAASGNMGFTVTDGDTIKLKDGTRVRLVGFNTPEKFEPECSREAALGNRASERLNELVAAAASTDVTLVACSCRPGTEGTKKCNYGRSCGRLTVDGRDVGETLIGEGLAVPFVCGVSGCPPTPRPWCG